MSKYGAIEAGGTKFICGVGTGPDDLVTTSIPTTTPKETITEAIAFLQAKGGNDLQSVGIGSFGPVDLHRQSPSFGYITSTPKSGWQDCDLVGPIKKSLGVPVGFDTDVNAAALGEWRWGAAQGLTDFIYLTVGTGIGGGAVAHGKLVHGLTHPEMGHIRIPRDLSSDGAFAGVCPFHGDCLEGLASGPAMKERWKVSADELPADHQAWSVQARYLALGLVTWICTLSPQRIILGGGVMKKTQLFPLIRAQVLELLNNYVRADAIIKQIDSFVVPPALGDRAGILGSMVLAETAIESPHFPSLV